MENFEKNFHKPQEEIDADLIEMRKESILQAHKVEKDNATEKQKELADIQGRKYETMLCVLMRRTGDNPELINGLNELIDALSHQVSFGDSEKPIHPGRVEELTAYLKEKSEELRWDVGGGNRPVHREQTWKWEK